MSVLSLVVNADQHRLMYQHNVGGALVREVFGSVTARGRDTHLDMVQ